MHSFRQTVVVAAASQLVAAGRPAPAGPAPVAVPAAEAPAVGALDGTDTVTPTSGADLGRIQADIAFWSGRLKAHPNDFVSAEKWGETDVDLARATGDVTAYLRAGAAFDEALRLYPDMPAARGFKGAVLVSLHKFTDAAALARTTLAETANDPTALATLGDASLELGDVPAARNAYERLASAAPSAAADALCCNASNSCVQASVIRASTPPVANIQPSEAAAVAIWVAAAAMPALTLAVTAEPALKPNQPTHRSEAPMMLSTRLCGAMFSVP